MFTYLLKRMPIFFVPAAILIATWFLVPRIAGLPPARQELVVFAPYIVTLLGMFLAVHFHRARPFMALLLLVLFYWASRTSLAGGQIEPALNKVYQALVLLIPLNMLLFTLMRERGIFSTAGRLRFVFLALQAAGCPVALSLSLHGPSAVYRPELHPPAALQRPADPATGHRGGHSSASPSSPCWRCAGNPPSTAACSEHWRRSSSPATG